MSDERHITLTHVKRFVQDCGLRSPKQVIDAFPDVALAHLRWCVQRIEYLEEKCGQTIDLPAIPAGSDCEWCSGSGDVDWIECDLDTGNPTGAPATEVCAKCYGTGKVPSDA